MVKNTTKAQPTVTDGTAAPTADKAKRKILTPAERLAKLDEERKALIAKVQKKDQDRKAQLTEQRKKLVEKRDDADARIKGIDDELAVIEQRLEAGVDGDSES